MTRFKANQYKKEKDALDSIERIKEIMFGAPTDRQRLEAENTECQSPRLKAGVFTHY